MKQTYDINIDISIGVAVYPEHGQTLEALIQSADRALYIAKKGGHRIQIGQEEYPLDETSISIMFQPLLDVRSNQPIGYEALSRDPQGKLSVLDLFKRYRAIGKLDDLKSVCFKEQINAANEAGLSCVFINVDFNLLRTAELIQKPPDMKVVLEISELEAIQDVETCLKTVQLWRRHGFEFAIDDFGAGFVSLPFIASLVPDYIKLDRSTIIQATTSREFREFLNVIIPALQNYTKQGVVAEGVETEKELQVVNDLGIHFAQGFLLGKPSKLR